MTNRQTLLAAALAHAARGWHVFPLWPGSKTPAVPDSWERRATRDPEVIRRWWQARPFNIGIAVGPSGLIVIDLDAPKPARPGVGRGAGTSVTSDTSQVTPGAACVGSAPVSDTSATGRHGRDVFVALCAEHGQPIPADTYTVATAHSGWQLYYQHPGGPALRNTKGGTARALGDNIDTRAHGGYVVAAGSIVDGRTYTVVCRAEPMRLPGWLADVLHHLDQAATAAVVPVRPVAVPLATDRRGAYLRAALTREAEHVAAAPTGRRNAVLWGAAVALGQLVAGGDLTADVVTEVLEQAASAAGLKPHEARPTIRSGLRRGAHRPRTVA